jgi:RND family efflux transporter MFP subunit
MPGRSAIVKEPTRPWRTFAVCSLAIDEIDLRLAQMSASAAVASARSRRDVARDNLQRGKALLPSAIISQAAYDTRQNEMDAAASALEAAEAQLRQAVNAVGYATLRADKAGIVTAVMAEPGQVVNAGQTIITLAHANATEISVAVPEQDCGYLTPGQRAKIRLWAGPNVSMQGRIREIAGQADPAARTYAVRISVSESPQIMRLGMTASVTLHIDDEPACVVGIVDRWPIGAVLDQTKRAVYFGQKLREFCRKSQGEVRFIETASQLHRLLDDRVARPSLRIRELIRTLLFHLPQDR